MNRFGGAWKVTNREKNPDYLNAISSCLSSTSIKDNRKCILKRLGYKTKNGLDWVQKGAERIGSC